MDVWCPDTTNTHIRLVKYHSPAIEIDLELFLNDNMTTCAQIFRKISCWLRLLAGFVQRSVLIEDESTSSDSFHRTDDLWTGWTAHLT